MEELLKQFVGKKIDVSTGITTAFRGDLKAVDAGVLHIVSDDGKTFYVAVEKVAAFYECSDTHSRPGFIG